jgi:hypothetical protein
MLISRPSAHRPDILMSLDVNKASILYPAFEKGAGAGFHVSTS